MTKDLERLQQLASAQPGRPPVEQWHPALSGDIDIRIDRDGCWHHEGEPIRRPALVNLFASILRREADGDHYLVTPVEKWRIQVEDAPLIAVDAELAGSGCDATLHFTLNTGMQIAAGPAFPLEVVTATDGSPRPYLILDRGLRALVTRSLFYRLVELAELQQGRWLIRSGGAEFCIGKEDGTPPSS
jgi:hypothetical protein